MDWVNVHIVLDRGVSGCLLDFNFGHPISSVIDIDLIVDSKLSTEGRFLAKDDGMEKGAKQYPPSR